MDKTVHIDEKIFDETKALMKSKFPDFLQSYLTSMDEYVESANIALSKEDFLSVKNNVHPIKSTSHAIGAVSLGNIADTLQNIIDGSISNNQPVAVTDVSALYQDLADEYSSVRLFLLKELDSHNAQ